MNTVQPHRPAINDRKVRFALLGCGRIANNHFEAIRTHDDRAELVAVADTDPAALAAAVAKTGAQGFSSLTAMLAGARADCVVLTTPSGLHPHQHLHWWSLLTPSSHRSSQSTSRPAAHC